MSAQILSSPSGNIRILDVNGGSTLAVAPTLMNAFGSLTVPAFYRALAFIADNMASFPRWVRPPEGTPADAPDHKLTKLLQRRPNGYQNDYRFWQTFFFHFGHQGNAFARIMRTGADAAALHNLSPDDVVPFRYQREGEAETSQYYFVRSTKTFLLGNDVLHIGLLSWDGMISIDPLSLFESALQRAATLEKYQTKFLQQGTVIRGAIMIPSTATDDQIKQVKAELHKFLGIDASEDILVLSGGAELKNSTVTPRDSQLNEQSLAATKAISQITGVDPAFLFERSESKYTGTEDAGENVVRYLFRPIIEQVESELSMKLLSEADQDAGWKVKINPNALIKGSTKTQSEVVSSQKNAGLITTNEGRTLLDLPIVKDADADKLITLGSTTPAPSGEATSEPAGDAKPGEASSSAVVDSSGQAEAGVVTELTLNGAQIEAAISVIEKLRAREITAIVATELLVAVGIPRDKADAMVNATQASGPPPVTPPPTAPPLAKASDASAQDAAENPPA